MSDSIKTADPHLAITIPPFEEAGFLEWMWFQRTVQCFSAILPTIALIVWADNARFNHIEISVPTVLTVLLILANSLLAWSIVSNFDSGTFGMGNARWLSGYILKFLACIHAVGAMFMVGRQVDYPLPEGFPAYLLWIVFTYCWIITAFAYLVGDAQIRGSRTST